MDKASARYVDSVAGAVREVLDARTTGVYLHGSAALGGYDVRRSDLDVLVVSDGALARDEQLALAELLSEERLPCPAHGLEMSVITLGCTHHPVGKPAFELHVTTAPEDTKVIDGHGRSGDPDLVLHFAVCRSAGVLVGPGLSREAAFAPVPHGLVLGRLVDELAWGAEHAATEYAVLNACRAEKFAVDGTLVSKVAGGEWALARAADPDFAELVAQALARQRLEGAAVLDVATVRRFVEVVRERLSTARE